jgi:hypothetical protein
LENTPKNENAKKTLKGMKTAYLLGNGINRMPRIDYDRYEWGNLLLDLNQEFALNSILNIREKPFPMVYDEIVSYSLRNGNQRERNIKTFIQDKIEIIQTNSRYDNLININGSEILTTNYDYLIEKSLNSNWQRNPINRLEYNYSIYRFQQSSNSNIWHIHGEQADSRSLMLGFKHYMDYSSKVKARAELFINGLRTNIEHNNPSWVDLFFTHNIKIIGLGMSFTEYPLWWLLAYRNQIILSNSNLDVNNNINFFIPSFKKVENADLIDMLQSYGVNCTVIDVLDNDYDNFYEKALASI